MRTGRVVELPQLAEGLAGAEAAWDPVLGGRQTRAYRDLLAYSAAKLVVAGGSPESVCGYLMQLFADHGADLVELRDSLARIVAGPGPANDVDEDDAGDGGKGGSA